MTKSKRPKLPKTQQSKSPRRNKWNFEKIYKEFCISRDDKVKTFFEHTYGTYNRHIAGHTTGWAEKKKAWQAGITESSLEKVAEKKAVDYADMITKMLVEIDMRLLSAGKLTSQDFERFFSIIRTMQGQPSKITRQTMPEKEDETVDYSEDEKELLKKHDDSTLGADKNIKKGK